MSFIDLGKPRATEPCEVCGHDLAVSLCFHYTCIRDGCDKRRTPEDPEDNYCSPECMYLDNE